VRRVFCQLRRVLSLGDAEDVVRIVVEMRSGALGEIDINQASTHSPFELEVVGTRGTLVKEGQTFRLRYFSPQDLQHKELNRSLASHQRQYPRDQIPLSEEIVEIDQSLAVDVYADFARAVHTGVPPLVQASEAVAVMRLIAQCRENSQKILATPA
jgi:predicted dehydrogenase